MVFLTTLGLSSTGHWLEWCRLCLKKLSVAGETIYVAYDHVSCKAKLPKSTTRGRPRYDTDG
jgi:hypothetical protein